MNKLFYAKLAAQNLKKNSRSFLPYLLSCVITITMYYVFVSLTFNPAIKTMRGGYVLQEIFNFGSIVIGLFSCIFLFYTNTFLIKNRKREFGLFNLLGMEKKHLAFLIFWETLYTIAISLCIGLGFGIILDKLLFLGINRIFADSLSFGFFISPTVILNVVELFAIIFALIFIRALFHVQFSSPLELLKASQTGERAPKANWLVALIGASCLGTGYFMSLTIKSPFTALTNFFTAVLLVIIGTYLLFHAGSITFLKLLQKNKNFYYQPRHFISISSMLYRMKQNAVGLANICILSTMVLVTVSTTCSLALGIEDSLSFRNPFDVVGTSFPSLELSEQEKKQAIEQTKDFLSHDLEQSITDTGLSPKEIAWYEYLVVPALQSNDTFKGNLTAMDMNALINMNTLDDRYVQFVFISKDEYNRITGNSLDPKGNEVYFYSFNGVYPYNTITLFDSTFQIQSHIDGFLIPADIATDLSTSYFLIADSATIAQIQQQSAKTPTLFYGFDLDNSSEQILAHSDKIDSLFIDLPMQVTTHIKADERNDQIAINGGLFFIGILLGLLFTMAAVLIIYYKQISEGMADKARFEILQKVGMSQTEVRKTIHSQVLTVFFLPLLTAGIHTGFAFPLLDKIIQTLGFFKSNLFALAALVIFLIFAAIYAIVYWFTSKAYYRIVKR